MKKLTKFISTFGCALASLALFIGTNSIESACVLFLHQPEIPEEMNKFKKIQ